MLCCVLALRWGVGLVIDSSPVQIPAGLLLYTGSLNRVPASAGGKGKVHTSAGWQLASNTVCSHNDMQVSRSGES